MAGIYTYTYAAERNENCVACSQIPKTLVFDEKTKLKEVLDHLTESFQMKNPGVTTTDLLGRNRTLYLPSVSSIEERTRPNLKKTLAGRFIFESCCGCRHLSLVDRNERWSIDFQLATKDKSRPML